MLTRDDVLRIRSIEEAFDLSTPKVRKREVALIRVAERERLIRLTEHAEDAAIDDAIDEADIFGAVRRGSAGSKDCDQSMGRQIGINFEADSEAAAVFA
ncbi:MAG TPA: hypothetical protein VK669_03065 [Candidatus Limnocylindrales bacterium]|nr:hypothetical protein [Candidatus Limnocylindrales bacterium]